MVVQERMAHTCVACQAGRLGAERITPDNERLHRTCTVPGIPWYRSTCSLNRMFVQVKHRRVLVNFGAGGGHGPGNCVLSYYNR